MKSILSFIAVSVAFAAVAAAKASDFGPAHVSADPVSLENDYLKITVDLSGGGTARSVIDKADGRELTHEYLTDKGWNGAFGRDRCVEEGGYPSVLQFIGYTGGKTVTPGGVQTLALTSRVDNARIGKWKFTKVYTLEPDAKRFKIVWSAVNENAEPRWLTPWKPNIVHRSFDDTLYVAKNGVMTAKRGHDFFHYPERNWLVASDPKTGRSVTFMSDWENLLSQYWCWWSGCHSIEWVYLPRRLAPGDKYELSYWIGFADIPERPAVITPDGALSWRNAGDWIELAFSPSRFGKFRVQPRVNGQDFGAVHIVTAEVGRVVRLSVPTNGLPRRGEFELSVEGAPRCFAGFENALSFTYDLSKDVTTTAQRPWKRAESTYKRVGGRDVPARKVLDGIYETSPLMKVFKDDRLHESALKRDCRLVRGGRFTWSFTVVNTNSKEAISFKIPQGYLTDGRGGVLPYTVGGLEWVTIDLPTMFRPDLAVGDYPDPIVPLRNDRFTVPPGENKTFFVMCDVPADAPAGVYTGRLNVMSGVQSRHIRLTAEVLDVSLPLRSSLRSTAGKWNPRKNILESVGYTGTVAEFGEAAMTLYAKNRVTPREAGIDWYAPAEKLAAQLRAADAAGMTMFHIPSALCKNPDGPHMRKAVRVLRELGLMDRAYDYLIDEPTNEMFPGMIAKVEKLRELYPDLRILATVYARNVHSLFGYIDIWCRKMKADPWRAERRAAGDEFLTSNLANAFVEAPLAALVRQFPLMKANDVSGFLYWNFICGYGDSNPWERLAVSGENGGAHMLYPYTTGPVETIRWRAMGWGIELFDLITLMDAKPLSAAAKERRAAVWARIRAADERRDLRDETELESLRSEVLDVLKSRR